MTMEVVPPLGTVIVSDGNSELSGYRIVLGTGLQGQAFGLKTIKLSATGGGLPIVSSIAPGIVALSEVLVVGGANLIIGSDELVTPAKTYPFVTIQAGTAIDWSADPTGTSTMRLTKDEVEVFNGKNLGVIDVPGSSTFGNGKTVIYIQNANTVPNANPAAGVILYVDPADGHLKYRKANGVIIDLG